MKISNRRLRRIIKEALSTEVPELTGGRKSSWQVKKEKELASKPKGGQLKKGDKVVVSEDGLFKFAKTAPHTMRDLENKLHDALNNKTVGTVIMIAPGKGARVNFDNTAVDVYDWMLEKV